LESLKLVLKIQHNIWQNPISKYRIAELNVLSISMIFGLNNW